MNNPMVRQPDKKELRAMLQVNVCILSLYFAAIRATPLVRHPLSLVSFGVKESIQICSRKNEWPVFLPF